MIDEGYTKFRSDWRSGPPLDHIEINEIIRWRTPLHAAGLIGHDEDFDVGYGNISMRAGSDDGFVITGTQTGHLELLDRTHFALVTGCDPETNTVTATGPAEPSSESMTHAALYRLEPTIRAVVHVHNQQLWLGSKDVLPTTAENVDYGTPRMAQEFERLFNDTDFPVTGIAVMAGHQGGLVSIGCSMQEAAERILSTYGEFMS